MFSIPQGLRPLRRRPALAAGVILVLGLAAGLSSAMFGLVRATVLLPRQSFDAGQIFAIFLIQKTPFARRTDERLPPILTPEKVEQFVTQPPPPFQAVIAGMVTDVVARLDDRAERVRAEFVLGDYERALRLRAGIGRFLDPSHSVADTAAVAVVSDRLWREWFVPSGATPGSAKLVIDGRAFTVIGAAPQGFRGVIPLQPVEIWLPAGARRADPARDGNNPAFNAQLFVRAPIGMSAGAVADAMRNALGIEPHSAWSDAFNLSAFRTDSLAADSLDRAGWILLAFGGLVMLAGSVNALNLLHVYFAARSREFATRRAIGASATSIAAMCTGEIAVLAALALVAGMVAAWGLLAAVNQTAPLGLASSRAMIWRSGSVFSVVADGAVIGYALISILVSAAALSLLTVTRVLRLSSGNPLLGASSASAPRSAGRHVVLSLQITIATVLMLGTSTLIVRLTPALDQSSAMTTTGAVASRIDLSLHGYSAVSGREYYERLLMTIARTPGIESAAVTDGIPGYAYVSNPNFQIVAEPDPATLSNTPRNFVNGSYAGVSENFFGVMRLPIVKGRSVAAADGYGAPLVVVVSESAAARLWPGRDVLGKRIMFGNEGQWRTVVGVSTDPIRVRNDRGPVCRSCVVFVPFQQRYSAQMVLVARAGSASGGEALIRRAVAEEDRDVIPFDLGPLDSTLLKAFWRERSAAVLVSATGIVSLLIAAIGVFSATAYVVNLRAFEMAVRMALGATPGRVIGLVLRDVRLVTLIGLLAGVAIAAFGERGFSSLIKGFIPNDLWIWAIVLLSVPAVTIGAGYLPARRSTRVVLAELLRGGDS